MEGSADLLYDDSANLYERDWLDMALNEITDPFQVNQLLFCPLQKYSYFLILSSHHLLLNVVHCSNYTTAKPEIFCILWCEPQQSFLLMSTIIFYFASQLNIFVFSLTFFLFSFNGWKDTPNVGFDTLLMNNTLQDLNFDDPFTEQPTSNGVNHNIASSSSQGSPLNSDGVSPPESPPSALSPISSPPLASSTIPSITGVKRSELDAFDDTAKRMVTYNNNKIPSSSSLQSSPQAYYSYTTDILAPSTSTSTSAATTTTTLAPGSKLALNHNDADFYLPPKRLRSESDSSDLFSEPSTPMIGEGGEKLYVNHIINFLSSLSLPLFLSH